MEEYKFRAWNKNTKKMYKIGQITLEKGTWNYEPDNREYIGMSVPYQPSFILMQYTGLKDKNGKEIYEGDIVEWAGYKMEVFWGEDIGIGYGSCWRPCGDNKGYHESMTGFIDEYEVIGNIYDNPELLKK